MLKPRLRALPVRRCAPSYSTTSHAFPRADVAQVQNHFAGQNRYAIEFARASRLHQSLHLRLASAAQMKREGVQPNLVIYNCLLEAAAHGAFWLEAWAILDDMRLLGIEPNIMCFNYLLHAVRYRHSHHVARVLKKMEDCGVKPNSQTLNLLITRYVAEDNLELALRHLLSSPQNDIVPDIQTVQSVIILAARNNFARLALDLVHWFERISARRLEESAWTHCLIAATETSYADGVEQCWATLTKHFKILLDEGICVSVLNTAARHGLPQLATEALQMLQKLNVQPEEHHFAAIIEAFCRLRQFKEALLVLDLMTSSNITPSAGTTKPLSDHIEQDAESIDATWRAIDELHKDGRRIDISAPRAVISAAISQNNFSKAIAFYEALPGFNLSPDLSIFNLLLQGCVQIADRQLGDTILTNMKANKIKPNQDTYGNFINLCLTQSSYEDAFFYLEEMKAAGFKPSASVYIALVDKCFESNDLRYQIALEEMEECGYTVPQRYQKNTAALD
ncbi:hypothetical protein Agabi119p4_1874 [Agaricus bisporus var. burnettii]|uniref:Pentatricopeptide repeat-containing protein-mitochondrial domain-containing protein n=1 Tax=Agaricus bisporus var. burnettii TaxID=192524 RepID=A0A8H7F865_AGABI|nr:hypothetical protein Agabi119p4_1874 [Agaricus bisporus var. burnettii]